MAGAYSFHFTFSKFIILTSSRHLQDAIELFQIKKSLYIPHRERPAEFDAEIKNPQFLA
jgi:hypothetical protein